jgi:hypothetical protein
MARVEEERAAELDVVLAAEIHAERYRAPGIVREAPPDAAGVGEEQVAVVREDLAVRPERVARGREVRVQPEAAAVRPADAAVGDEVDLGVEAPELCPDERARLEAG